MNLIRNTMAPSAVIVWRNSVATPKAGQVSGVMTDYRQSAVTEAAKLNS